MSDKPRVALVSLGCPKNLVDSQAMLGLLEQAGYPIVEETRAAEVLIVNTCAFIEPAIEEAVDALLELADLKAQGLRGLICAGCLTQRGGQALLKELPEVDVFLGVGAVPRVAEAVEMALRGERGVIEAGLEYLYTGDTPRLHTGPAWLSYLKIADGCHHRCAFCTIPDIRGKYRSVPPTSVRAQYADLIAQGVQEIVLIGQDTSAYGRELEPRTSLAELLGDLRAVDFDGWLRVLYLYPSTVDEALLDQMCAGPPVVPYFDIPLQHVAPGVLQAMRRPGSYESYLRLVEAIRSRDPLAAIRTTFIVGFPGETKADFELLLDFIREARLDRVSVFRYWPEEGTEAAALPRQVPMEVGDDRLDQLMQLQEMVSLSVSEKFVGKRLRVLVEEPLNKRVWSGRSFRDAPEVDGAVKIEVPFERLLKPGQFAVVEIDRAEVHDLQGRIGPVS